MFLSKRTAVKLYGDDNQAERCARLLREGVPGAAHALPTAYLSGFFCMHACVVLLLAWCFMLVTLVIVLLEIINTILPARLRRKNVISIDE